MSMYLQRSLYTFLLLSFVSGAATAQGLQLEHPLIAFNSEGHTRYEAALDQFTVLSIPLAIQTTAGGIPVMINQPAELNIAVEIDETGALIGGLAGPDLRITGATVGIEEVLLTGEIQQFIVINSAGPTDIYEFIFEVTGGTLAADYSGGNVGVELTSEQSSFDGSFNSDFAGGAKGTVGRVAATADCSLTLDKTCLIVTPASDDFACSDKIVAARFRYIGPGYDGFMDVQIVGSSGATASYVTELTPNQSVLIGQNGFSIDATFSGESDLGSKTSIFINGAEEVLHTSCSAPFVAGQPAPLNDPKGDPSPNWLIEAFIDKDGNDVSLPNPQFAESCEIPALGNAECEHRPSAIQFRYTGADCTASSNNQPADKFECADYGSTTDAVDIRIVNGNTIYADVTGVTAGALIDAADGGSDFDSEIFIEIRDLAGNLLQSLRLHTSCSQPLALGDRFGGMDLVSFTNDEQGTVQNGAEVVYRYAVSNQGSVAATNVIITDTGLNPPEVPGSPIATLGAGHTQILEATAFVDAATPGIAMLSATVDGQTCETSDSTPITIATPPPCNIGSHGFELKDDAFKWDLSNLGANAATIESISIAWPDQFGALREIKLEGDKIMDQDMSPPATTIDTFLGDIDKRQIEPGRTDTLEFKFEEKYKDAQPGDFTITVSFVEGCEVTFEPGMNAFGDCDGKIRELTMIWDGMIEPVNIRAYAGAPGSTLVTTSGDLYIGDPVTAGDFTVAGAPNDVFFEVLDSVGNLIGESKFHRSCSDDEMDGPEDCGMPQGNGKSNDSGFINDWLLGGLRDDDSVLDCANL